MNRSNKIGQESEKLSAKIYGKKVPASGSGMFEKLDIQGMGMYAGWRGENKATERESFSIKTEMLLKGIKQAFAMGVRPFYIFDFKSINRRFVLVEEERWIQLFQLLEEEDA